MSDCIRCRAGWWLGLASLVWLASAARAQSFELRWGGLVHDTTTADGLENWTVEDGGRIRHRAANQWTFQNVPSAVKDTLRRVFFLPDRLHGWAVGQNGWVVRTTDGGAQWDVLYHMPAVTQEGGEFEDLWDVHFLDANLGWLVGLHWIWSTTDGGQSWTPCTLIDENGAAIVSDEIELYAVDVVPGTALAPQPGWTAQPPGMLLGLAASEPGYVLRSVDGVTWQVAFDVRDICASLPACAQVICDVPEPGEKPIPYEPWDIEISRHATQSLALVVGGVDNGCGLIFASTNGGLAWTSEPHECKCSGQPGCINCNSNPLYNDNTSTQTDTWRLKKYFTLYGVGIFDADNSAVACGYSGQHLVRDPVNRIWRDRSSFTNDPVHAPNAVTLPLFGAEANAGNGASGIAYITGMGGYVRRSTNGGQAWTTEQLGEPWRVRDTFFFDLNTGWMVGQFFRLARSTDGGRTWTPAQPEPQLGTGFLHAITFSNPAIGVAVGDIDLRPGPNQNKPKILITQDGGATPWLEPSIYPLRPVVASMRLNEVTAAGPLEFWAVGDAGLMLHSTDGGDSWNQFAPPGLSYPDLRDIEFHSVAFRDDSNGIFVGQRPDGSGGLRGIAYLYRNSNSQVTWTQITPSDHPLTVLADVDVSGDVAYAVGVRGTGEERVGVIYASTGSNGAFGEFVEMAHPTFAACDVDEDLDKVPVLNEVEIAPDGDVWVGGECGRLWQFVPPNQWIEQKSGTDAHVLGMSVPLADTGFLANHRASRTGQSIVRFRP